jgi:hypothetical protein
MKRKLPTLTLASVAAASFTAACLATDAPVSPAVASVAPAAASNTSTASPFAPFTPLTAAQRAARPRQAPLPGAASASTTPAPAAAAVDTSATQADVPKFISEDKWILAGYNNDELVYTVVVTNQDTHIIRCTTEVNGFYIEDGKKLTITDRQITTVFPNQPTRTGYWMDMDKDSGATYAVKCKAV